MFKYGADLEQSGNVTQTESKSGKLAVFNWAPVQWDDAMEHETVIIHFPVEFQSPSVKESDIKSLKFYTERFVNQKYLIDYPLVKGGDDKKIFFSQIPQE